MHGPIDGGANRPHIGPQRYGAAGPFFSHAGGASSGQMRGGAPLHGRAGGLLGDRLGPQTLNGSGAGGAPPFAMRGSRGDDLFSSRGNGAEGQRRDAHLSLVSRGSGSFSGHDPHWEPLGGSAYVRRESTSQHDLRRGRDWGRDPGSQDRAPSRADDNAVAGPARRRVLSSVVVGATRAIQDGTGTEDAPQPSNGISHRHSHGHHEFDQQPEVQEAPRGSKRPALPLPDPDNAKRARRLLGRTLLGTLQKFRQEDAQFKVRRIACEVDTAHVQRGGGGGMHRHVHTPTSECAENVCRYSTVCSSQAPPAQQIAIAATPGLPAVAAVPVCARRACGLPAWCMHAGN
jgi:hypothetical protein